LKEAQKPAKSDKIGEICRSSRQRRSSGGPSVKKIVFLKKAIFGILNRNFIES